MATKRKGLGRGLDALLGSAMAGERTAAGLAQAATAADSPRDENQLVELSVELLQRGKFQPRRDMHPEALEELADSIKSHGVMQPIVVRGIGGGRYEIIAGERRWRATQQAGLTTIPATIHQVSDEAAIAMALIENIQREDLNPIEEAMALQRLMDEFDLTQQKVAEAVGKSRTTVTNLLRLIKLTAEVKRMVEYGDLEMGHARALLPLEPEQQVAAARELVAKGLSVRQTEELVKKIQTGRHGNTTKLEHDPAVQVMEQRWRDQLGMKVKISQTAKGEGRITLSYDSLTQLEDLLSRLH